MVEVSCNLVDKCYNAMREDDRVFITAAEMAGYGCGVGFCSNSGTSQFGNRSAGVWLGIEAGWRGTGGDCHMRMFRVYGRLW